MSAYMVRGETINKVVAVLTHNQYFSVEQKRELGAALIEMNADAVGSKYSRRGVVPPDFELDDIDIDHAKFEAGDRELLCPLIKTMDCFLYQCHEGDVPNSDLYRQCEAARNDMMQMVVGALSEYINADWG